MHVRSNLIQCTNVDLILIADQRNQSYEKNWTKKSIHLILAPSMKFNIMSYFIYTDLISSMLDQRPVDPGSHLIHICAYGPKYFGKTINQFLELVDISVFQ